ncbi:MAG: hypothetical protein ACHQ2Z_06885 [Elusimicrobiota bacterium]
MSFRRDLERQLQKTLTVAAMLILARTALAAEFRQALHPHGMTYSGKKMYQVTLDRSLSDGGSRRLTAESGATRVKIATEPARDAAAARKLLSEWKTRLYGQFEGAMSYPGMVTRRYDIPEALRPRALAAAGGRAAWIVPATDRLTFGAGADDLVRYIAVVTHRWCPEAGRAVELTLFYPRESFSEKAALVEEAAFTCPRSSVPSGPGML